MSLRDTKASDFIDDEMSFDGVVINIASEVSESENIITKAEARVLLTLLHEYFYDEDSYKLHEAKYRGRKVKLNKPKRGGPKKFYVYVRNPKTGKVKRVTFGAKGMTTGLRDPKRSKSFELRHRCKQKKDKTKPGYWACRIGRYPKVTGAPYRRWW